MRFSQNAIQHGSQARESFRIFADGRGHWCARKNDGLVAGTFFSRDAAVRFARNEVSYCPALKSGPVPERDAALTPSTAPMRDKMRRAAILVQLAFVGFLLMGRVAAGVVDASVAPSFDPAVASGSSSAALAN